MANQLPSWAYYAYEIKSEDDCEVKTDATYEQVNAWTDAILAEIDKMTLQGKAESIGSAALKLELGN